ncbi:alpha/beta fold hydrolase [Azohydromonas australica]|uniref:alpha/beta fold hydrolase n=1 Tax=Azohydromonas australica TaxID=364039 RepID=UPI0004226E6B|nr:alpha/beta hydrolase [Azohydromonas australica]
MKTLPDLAGLEAAARVERTPCGTGTMVWHLWGNGLPVVLLHGGAGSWTHWARNIEALANAGRQVLVPDLPGFGDSASPPEGQDADALPPWLETGLCQLVGRESIDLVGFSFGGLVAGLLAARRQQPVRRLILVGAPALTDQPIARIALRAWQAEPPGPARDAVHRHNLERLMLAHASSVDALALRIHDDNLQRDRMRQRRLQATDLLLRTLPTIACPVAGIWGAEDALYRGRLDVVEHALRQAPVFESLVFIPHAGHWVQFENASAFNAALAIALGSEAL